MREMKTREGKTTIRCVVNEEVAFKLEKMAEHQKMELGRFLRDLLSEEAFGNPISVMPSAKEIIQFRKRTA